MTHLHERIERLEQQATRDRASLRRYRTLCLGAGVAGLCAAALAATSVGPTVMDSIRASRLEIVDDRGNVVMVASADEIGGQIDLWTSDGANFFRVAGNETGGDLVLWDNNGRSSFGAYSTKRGGEVAVYDQAGREALLAGGEPNGGRLILRNQSGDDAFTAQATASGGQAVLRAGANDLVTLGTEDSGGAVSIYDSNGDLSVMAGSDEAGGLIDVHVSGGGPAVTTGIYDDAGAITVANTEGRTLLWAGADAHGHGVAHLADKQGKTRFVAGVNESDTGFVSTFNASGSIAANISDQGDRRGAVAGAKAQAAEVAELVRTRKIEVVDDDGKVLFSAEQGEHGGALSLRNNDGHEMCAVSSSGQGGELSLFDHSGQETFAAYNTRHGGATSMRAANGKEVAVLAAAADGGQLHVRQTNGESAFEATATADGGAARVKNRTGVAVYAAQATEDQTGRVALNSADGRRAMTLDIKTSGGILSMWRGGQPLFAISASPAGGLFNLMNRHGEVVFLAGSTREGDGGALAVKNNRGVNVLHAGVNKGGDGQISVRDGSGQQLTTIRATEKKEPLRATARR